MASSSSFAALVALLSVLALAAAHDFVSPHTVELTAANYEAQVRLPLRCCFAWLARVFSQILT